jgi:hypothetical protein
MSTTYSKLSRGISWEYRVHRAVFLSGWYVRRSVNLRERVRSSPQTMAEVDILAIDFDVALTRRVLVGECKDRKGGAKEADRVIWLLGLAKMLSADHILFAKTSLADGTIQVARPFGLMLWDEAAVLAVEKRFGLAPDTGYVGSWGIELREDVLIPARKGAALRDTAFRSAWDFLAGSFWYQANPPRTKRLAAYFEALAEARSLKGQIRSSFVAEGLIALLVTLYTTAGDLAAASPSRAEGWLVDAFASGAASAHVLRDIAARADDFYQDALGKAGPKDGRAARSAVEVPRLAPVIAEPPSWIGPYLDVARRLGERPQIATDALRYAELILFEEMIAGNDASTAVKDYIGTEPAELATVLEVGALFLQRVWGVDDPLLDGILGKRSKKQPNVTPASRDRPAAPAGGKGSTQLALADQTAPRGS